MLQEKLRPTTCARCKILKDPADFDSETIKHSKNRNRPLLCKQCFALGYSSHNLTTHRCVGNGGHDCGHRFFRATDIRAERIQKDRLLCKDCLQSQLFCAACESVQDNTNFPDGIATSRNNANKVCLSCKSRGLCTSDLTLYLCSKCGKRYGRKLFPQE